MEATHELQHLPSSRSLGAVYTPRLLAEWVAQEVAGHLEHKASAVLDPACGDGALLRAASDALDNRPRLIGIDVDESAINVARKQLPKVRTQLIKSDFLAPSASKDPNKHWVERLAGNNVSAIIANPPWGAHLEHSQAEYERLGYDLSCGQFDSYDLFVELCTKIVGTGKVLAFILPDSLFSPEHKPLRALLLKSTELLIVARLGEGFFPGIFRGAVVLVARKGVPSRDHQTLCVRLNKSLRKRVLRGELSLHAACREVGHWVDQERFQQDTEKRFDIDLRRHEEVVIRRIFDVEPSWTQWIESGRGVELSKTGAILACPACEYAYPKPRGRRVISCRACGTSFDTDAVQSSIIVHPLVDSGAVSADQRPLIVGEDVQRYFCSPSRSIRLGIRGINYKSDQIFLKRKLLIRKTGLGIKAAIDENGALTNQVVFHYYLPERSKVPNFFLDFLLGVLSSRVMLAYHLRRLGEKEWRSHPYITQAVLAGLPIPSITEKAEQFAQARAIADAVSNRRRVSTHSGREDLLVECLVAGLYGLGKADFQWVKEVLEDAEALEPIRTLQLSDWTPLVPLRVSQ